MTDEEHPSGNQGTEQPEELEKPEKDQDPTFPRIKSIIIGFVALMLLWAFCPPLIATS